MRRQPSSGKESLPKDSSKVSSSRKLGEKKHQSDASNDDKGRKDAAKVKEKSKPYGGKEMDRSTKKNIRDVDAEKEKVAAAQSEEVRGRQHSPSHGRSMQQIMRKKFAEKKEDNQHNRRRSPNAPKFRVKTTRGEESEPNSLIPRRIPPVPFPGEQEEARGRYNGEEVGRAAGANPDGKIDLCKLWDSCDKVNNTSPGHDKQVVIAGKRGEDPAKKVLHRSSKGRESKDKPTNKGIGKALEQSNNSNIADIRKSRKSSKDEDYVKRKDSQGSNGKKQPRHTTRGRMNNSDEKVRFGRGRSAEGKKGGGYVAVEKSNKQSLYQRSKSLPLKRQQRKRVPSEYHIHQPRQHSSTLSSYRQEFLNEMAQLSVCPPGQETGTLPSKIL